MYTLPLYRLTLVSCLYLPDDESYYKTNVNFGLAIPFSTSRGKIEGCKQQKDRDLRPVSINRRGQYTFFTTLHFTSTGKKGNCMSKI